MSLLRDIQDAAVDSEVDLASLLRKCKVLAARLSNDEFKKWVDNELSGYEDKDSLPDYRILHVHSKGHFSGPFSSGLRNANIPITCMPEKLREGLSNSYVLQPVAGLEALVEGDSGGSAQEAWSPDIVAHYGDKIYEGMNCMQAWKIIPLNAVVAILDIVRNRVLNFVLEIETEAPNAGEAPINSNPLPQEKVQQIFNTYISGDVQNVATGSSDFEQHAINVEIPEVFDQLLEAIMSSESEDIDNVTASVQEMKDSYGTASFKDRYQSFMAIMANHMTVLGPVVMPFLPALAALIP